MCILPIAMLLFFQLCFHSNNISGRDLKKSINNASGVIRYAKFGLFNINCKGTIYRGICGVVRIVDYDYEIMREMLIMRCTLCTR